MPEQEPVIDDPIDNAQGKRSLLGICLMQGTRQALDLFFPNACQACGAATAEREASHQGFCLACERDLLANELPACQRCAAPLPSFDGSHRRPLPKDCPVCREQKWKFEETIALGPYRDLLRHLVLKSKQRAGLSTARALGALTARHHHDRFAVWLQKDKTVVVPIPSHWTRRLLRGGNSPDAIAEGLAETLGLRTSQLLKRVRRTTKQTELAPTRRAANVRSAFKAQHENQIRGKRILLVDDVFTTGATLCEATRILLHAGAGQVIVVVPAKRVERL